MSQTRPCSIRLGLFVLPRLLDPYVWYLPFPGRGTVVPCAFAPLRQLSRAELPAEKHALVALLSVCFWRCLVLGGLLSGQSSLLIVDFLFELLSPFSFARPFVPPTLAYCLFNKQRLRLRRRRRRLQRAKESNEWRKLSRSKRGLEPMQ